MISLIRKIAESLELAATLRQTASKYAGQPEVMRAHLLEAIQKSLREGRTATNERSPSRLETATI